MASYDHEKVSHFIGMAYTELMHICNAEQNSGGNSLEKAPAGLVTDFVKLHGGHTVITKVRVPHSIPSCQF